VVEVKLVDVSRADGPSKTIAEVSKVVEGQSPILYKLKFDSADIQPGHSYALQARITVDGRHWSTTPTRHPVFAGTDRTEIFVQCVNNSGAASPETPVGRWLAEDIDGSGVIDRLQTVLEISADGSVFRVVRLQSHDGQGRYFRGPDVTPAPEYQPQIPSFGDDSRIDISSGPLAGRWCPALFRNGGNLAHRRG
jgi:putative lipoprotein